MDEPTTRGPMDDHERIDELLAAYALRSLDGDDARATDVLLAEHVPSCMRCRATLEAFGAISGDLALVPAPKSPPDLLLPRLRTEIEADRGVARGRGGRWRPVAMIAAAASIVAVVGLGAVSLSLGARANRAEGQSSILSEAIAGTKADLSGVDRPDLVESSRPDLHRFYIAGTGVPEPAPGMVYRIWLGSGGTYTWLADFVPVGGQVADVVEVDLSRYDHVVITEEPAGSQPTSPGPQVRWSAELPTAADAASPSAA